MQKTRTRHMIRPDAQRCPPEEQDACHQAVGHWAYYFFFPPYLSSCHLTQVNVSAYLRCGVRANTPTPNFVLTTRVRTLIVETIYLQLIQNRYMFRSFTVLHCSHQHCVQPVASDVEVVGYL